MSTDRDRIIEQALKHELHNAGAPAGDAHLDAETLAAWTDGGLDPTAMASAEAHVSVCARCQALVGTFARSAPTPVTSGTHASKAPWFWWLAPFAAGAAAVTIWMIVPRQQQLATAPPAPVAAEAIEPRSAPSPAAPAPVDQLARADKLEAKPTPVEPPRDIRSQETQDAELKKDQTPADRRERAANTLADSAVGGVAQATPAAPPAAAEAASEPAVSLQKSARFAAAPLEVVSPDPSRRWRVVATGVERSEDAGVTWIPVRAPNNEVITGATAVSRDICWFFGRMGLVLITVDGSTFARVDLRERIDITSLTASDARTATVTAADGRRFRTDDSGRTWRPN